MTSPENMSVLGKALPDGTDGARRGSRRMSDAVVRSCSLSISAVDSQYATLRT